MLTFKQIMSYILIILFFLLHLSSILKSDNAKFKYITLSENNIPESRLLIDKQKEKIQNKVKEKKKNKNKLEKIGKKEIKSKQKPVLKKKP